MTLKDRLNGWQDSKSLVWTSIGFAAKFVIESALFLVLSSLVLLLPLVFPDMHYGFEVAPDSVAFWWGILFALLFRKGWCWTSY